MKIVNYGHFQTVNGKRGTLYFSNEKGEDWYEIRKDLTNWDQYGEFIDAIFPTWVMVDKDGIVTNVEFDPSKLMPGDRTVLGIDAAIETIKPGMLWDKGKFKPATRESMESIGKPWDVS